MPSSINSRRSESESWLQRVRNCSARRLAAVLSSADELAFFVFIGQTVARTLGGAPFEFLAAALRVNAEHSAKPANTNASQRDRALFLPLRRRGVSPRGIRATGTQPDAGGFIPRGEPVAWGL